MGYVLADDPQHTLEVDARETPNHFRLRFVEGVAAVEYRPLTEAIQSL